MGSFRWRDTLKKPLTLVINLVLGLTVLLASQAQAEFYPCGQIFYNDLCPSGCGSQVEYSQTWACCNTVAEGCCQRLCAAVTCTGSGNCQPDPAGNYRALAGVPYSWPQLCGSNGLCGLQDN